MLRISHSIELFYHLPSLQTDILRDARALKDFLLKKVYGDEGAYNEAKARQTNITENLADYFRYNVPPKDQEELQAIKRQLHSGMLHPYFEFDDDGALVWKSGGSYVVPVSHYLGLAVSDDQGFYEYVKGKAENGQLSVASIKHSIVVSEFAQYLNKARRFKVNGHVMATLLGVRTECRKHQGIRRRRGAQQQRPPPAPHAASPSAFLDRQYSGSPARPPPYPAAAAHASAPSASSRYAVGTPQSKQKRQQSQARPPSYPAAHASQYAAMHALTPPARSRGSTFRRTPQQQQPSLYPAAHASPSTAASHGSTPSTSSQMSPQLAPPSPWTQGQERLVRQNRADARKREAQMFRFLENSQAQQNALEASILGLTYTAPTLVGHAPFPDGTDDDGNDYDSGGDYCPINNERTDFDSDYQLNNLFPGSQSLDARLRNAESGSTSPQVFHDFGANENPGPESCNDTGGGISGVDGGVDAGSEPGPDDGAKASSFEVR